MSKISTEQLDELQFGRQLHRRHPDADLIELVARTLFIDAAGEEENIKPDDLTATGLPAWKLYEDAAHAAIAALYEAGAMK